MRSSEQPRMEMGICQLSDCNCCWRQVECYVIAYREHTQYVNGQGALNPRNTNGQEDKETFHRSQVTA